MMRNQYVELLILFIGWSLSTAAVANSPAHEAYDTFQDGDDLFFCPLLLSSEDDDVPTVFRENVDSGEVFQVMGKIERRPGPEQGIFDFCIVDRCVAAGTYRYGADYDPEFWWGEDFDQIVIAAQPAANCADQRNLKEVDASKAPWIEADDDGNGDGENTGCAFHPPGRAVKSRLFLLIARIIGSSL